MLTESNGLIVLQKDPRCCVWVTHDKLRNLYEVNCLLSTDHDDAAQWITVASHKARFPVTPHGYNMARLSAAFMACMYAED